jgi:curved DNA-binding protein
MPGRARGFDGDGPQSEADFSDFFESLFGRNFQGAGFASGRRGGAGFARGPVGAPGEDHHAKIMIDLHDAYTGATRTVRLQRSDAQGRTQSHEIRFEVPRGVRAGQRIRLAGQGAPGTGQAQAGDLYLEVEFAPPQAGQPGYRVERHDVYLDLPVAPWEAALGATVQAPTPAGWLELRIPPNSPPGRKLRLKGRGLPASTPGDFYFVLQLATPAPSSDTDRRFYEDMAQRFKGFEPRGAWQRP